MPPEIVSESGEFSVGLFGENDNTRIVTDWLYYKTRWGCYDTGITPNPPTPSVYEQILGAFNDKCDKDHMYTECITKEEFNVFIEETMNKYLGDGAIGAGPINYIIKI